MRRHKVHRRSHKRRHHRKRGGVIGKILRAVRSPIGRAIGKKILGLGRRRYRRGGRGCIISGGYL